MKLEKFSKNKKQKRMFVGIGVFLVLLVGGIVLYKTFAFYEEKKEYNILQGQIPYFVSNDVKLALLLNGENVNSLPEGKEYVVVVECDKGAIGSWDYEDWYPKITNITEKTKCAINYQSPNQVNTLASKLGVSASNMESIIREHIDKLVGSKEGMIYLAKSPNLISEMKASSSYTEEVKLKLLDVDVISEEMKYETGLPCYLYRNGYTSKVAGELFPTFAPYDDTIDIYVDTMISRYQFMKEKNLMYLSSSFASSKVYISSFNKINLNNYNTISTYYQHWTDCSDVLTANFNLSINNIAQYDITEDVVVTHTYSNYAASGSGAPYNKLTLDVSNYNDSYYIHLSLGHGTEANVNTASVSLSQIALY